jgi:catalase
MLITFDWRFHTGEPAAKSQDANYYLFEEVTERVASGPIRFEIRVQVAKDGDVVDDATLQWPKQPPNDSFRVSCPHPECPR